MSLAIQPRHPYVRFYNPAPLFSQPPAYTTATSCFTLEADARRQHFLATTPGGWSWPSSMGPMLFGAVSVGAVVALIVANCEQPGRHLASANEAMEKGRAALQRKAWAEAATAFNDARLAVRRERVHNTTHGVLDWDVYVTAGLSSIAANLMEGTTLSKDETRHILFEMRADALERPYITPNNYSGSDSIPRLDHDLVSRLNIMLAYLKDDPRSLAAAWQTYCESGNTVSDFISWIKLAEFKGLGHPQPFDRLIESVHRLARGEFGVCF